MYRKQITDHRQLRTLPQQQQQQQQAFWLEARGWWLSDDDTTAESSPGLAATIHSDTAVVARDPSAARGGGECHSPLSETPFQREYACFPPDMSAEESTAGIKRRLL